MSKMEGIWLGLFQDWFISYVGKIRRRDVGERIAMRMSLTLSLGPEGSELTRFIRMTAEDYTDSSCCFPVLELLPLTIIESNYIYSFILSPCSSRFC